MMLQVIDSGLLSFMTFDMNDNNDLMHVYVET